MRKYLLALTILILTFKFGSSQTNVYYPFPDSNAIWVEYLNGGVPPDLSTDDHGIFIFNDTIIGNYSYHKLYESGAWSFGTPQLHYYSNIYMGAFRQDTLQKKVFFMADTASHERLLYDFNLNVGDTLPATYNNGNNSNKIIGIDSVLVGSNYHKRYYLATFYGNSILDPDYAIIEGVGSTLGLLYYIYPCLEACSRLTCFGNNGQYYPTNTTCPNTIGITEIKKQKFEIEIYPNPFSSQTTLHTDKMFKDAILAVYNSFGLQVKQIKNISGQTITLHRVNLPSGLYFIRLTQDNKVITQDKLVITD